MSSLPVWIKVLILYSSVSGSVQRPLVDFSAFFSDSCNQLLHKMAKNKSLYDAVIALNVK